MNKLKFETVNLYSLFLLYYEQSSSTLCINHRLFIKIALFYTNLYTMDYIYSNICKCLFMPTKTTEAKQIERGPDSKYPIFTPCWRQGNLHSIFKTTQNKSRLHIRARTFHIRFTRWKILVWKRLPRGGQDSKSPKDNLNRPKSRSCRRGSRGLKLQWGRGSGEP